jgi:hypothetical protein
MLGRFKWLMIEIGGAVERARERILELVERVRPGEGSCRDERVSRTCVRESERWGGFSRFFGGENNERGEEEVRYESDISGGISLSLLFFG